MKIKLVIATIIIVMVPLLSCSEDKPSQPEPVALTNRVWADSLEVEAGDKFSVSVNFENNVPLGGMVIPLSYAGTNLTLDSIAFEDSRLANLSFMTNEIYAEEQRLVISAFAKDAGELIDSGSGPICRLYFWVWGNAPTQNIVIDTVFIPPSIRFSFEDSAAVGFVPTYNPGLLQVTGFVK